MKELEQLTIDTIIRDPSTRYKGTIVFIVAGRQENISDGRSSNLPTVIFIKAMLENVFFCDNILSKLVGGMLNVQCKKV